MIDQLIQENASAVSHMSSLRRESFYHQLLRRLTPFDAATMQLNHPISDVLLDKSPDGLIGLDPRSMLLRIELLDDRLRRNLISFGSAVSSPPTFANRINISVRLTTPTRRPLILAPGRELAETDGPDGAIIGVFGLASATW